MKKRLSDFLLRLAARFNPKLKRLFASAGGTLERLETEVGLYRDRYSMERLEVLSRISELREAYAMTGAGPMQDGGKVAESARNGVFKEAIAELELALEDRGWKREQALAATTEFSRYGIQQIMLIIVRGKSPLAVRDEVNRRCVAQPGWEPVGHPFQDSSRDEWCWSIKYEGKPVAPGGVKLREPQRRAG